MYPLILEEIRSLSKWYLHWLDSLKLRKIPLGKYRLVFMKYGYYLVKRIFTVNSGKDEYIIVDLQAKSQEKTLSKIYLFLEKELILLGLAIFSFVALFFKDIKEEK